MKTDKITVFDLFEKQRRLVAWLIAINHYHLAFHGTGYQVALVGDFCLTLAGDEGTQS